MVRVASLTYLNTLHAVFGKEHLIECLTQNWHPLCISIASAFNITFESSKFRVRWWSSR